MCYKYIHISFEIKTVYEEIYKNLRIIYIQCVIEILDLNALKKLHKSK